MNHAWGWSIDSDWDTYFIFPLFSCLWHSFMLFIQLLIILYLRLILSSRLFIKIPLPIFYHFGPSMNFSQLSHLHDKLENFNQLLKMLPTQIRSTSRCTLIKDNILAWKLLSYASFNSMFMNTDFCLGLLASTNCVPSSSSTRFIF